MFELLVLLGVVALAGCVAIGLLKLLVALVILPFKAAFWLAKGVIGLVLVVPLAIIFTAVMVNALPIVLFVLFIPLLLVVGGLVFFVRLIL